MGMPATISRRDWTLDEFYAARDAAPSGERWEYVDGEVLVTPSPRWTHQHTSIELALRLAPYVKTQGIGRLLAAPLDVLLDPKLVLQPDLLVVPSGELRKQSDVVRHLVLAVEIVSPGSARYDRVIKRPRYQRNRVPDYWIIDAASQTIERWGPDDTRAELISERLMWQPQGAAEPFVLDLPAFFAELAVEP